MTAQTTKTPQPMSKSHANTKLPGLPGFTFTLTHSHSHSSLGTKLYQPTFDFNLSDPNCHIMKPSYNSLHDPNLNEYYHQRDKHEKLKRMKFITEDDQVVCSLKEYNTYKQYLRAVKNDHDKYFNKKMREQMIKLVKLQEEGHIPEDVTLGDMREFLLDNLTLSHTSRAEKQRAGQQTGSCRIKRENALCKQLEDWLSKELRSLLKLIEKDVKQEVNKAKYLRKIKEKRDNKKNIFLEQKQAIQQRKDRETLRYFQEYERMRETRIKQNMFLEQIVQAPELAPVQRPAPPARFKPVKRIVSLADDHMLPRLDHLSPLPGKGEPTLAKEIKTQLNSSTAYESTFTEPGTHTETNGEVDAVVTWRSKTPGVMQAVQSKVIQDPKVRKKESKCPDILSRTTSFPKLGKIEKPPIQPRSQAQLKSVVTNAILDHLGTRPVRKQLAESIVCGMDLKTSVQGLKPVAQRANSAKIATDLLKCVSRVVNPFKPSNEPVYRLRGGGKNSLSHNGQTDEPPDTGVDIDTYVTTLVNSIMESIREKVVVKIQEVIPEKFHVISAKASQTALDVVSDVLHDVQEFLVQGNIGHFGEGTSVPIGCYCGEGTPGAFTSEPPTIYVSEMELEEATSKVEDIACDLINTAYDNLLFKQELFERLTDNEPNTSKVILDPGNTDVIISGHESLITLPQVSTSPEEKISALNLQAVPCKFSLSSAVKFSSRVEMTPSETSVTAAVSEKNLTKSSSEASIVASVVPQRPAEPCLSIKLKEKTAQSGNANDTSLDTQDFVVDAEEAVSMPKRIQRKPAMLKRAVKENPSVSEFQKGSTGKNVPVASKSISVPHLYYVILDGVLDHFNTEPFKDRLAQSVRNEVRRSLSLPQVKMPGLHSEDCNETLQMIEDLMKSATQKVKVGCQSSSVESSANEETFAKLQAAASQLMKHVFQTVKEKFADKIKQGSPKRRLSPKVSQTAIDAMSNVLGSMETNVMTKASNSPSTSSNNLDELLEEPLFEHPAQWIDSCKIAAISDDLVENVLDMCCEMVLSGELPLETEPEVDDEHHLSGFNVGTIPSQATPLQNEGTSHINPITMESDHMCEPIVNRRLPRSSPGWKSADARRLIRVSCTFDPGTGSPQQKMYTARRSTSFPHLYYISIIDGVLDHMSTESFKDKMAQSVRNEVRHSLSLPEFGLLNLQLEDCADKDMIEDMLKSVSVKLSHCTPKSSQDSQLSAHRSDPRPSAAEEESENTQVVSLAKIEAVAKEYIIKFLEEVKAKLINKIKQGSPQRVLSPRVSHMAICAVNSILGGMGTSIREASTPLIPVTAGLQTGITDLTSVKVAEAVTSHPGTWLSPSKMEYLTSGLLETVFDNLLDEDIMILREPHTSASWKDTVTIKAKGEMSPPVVGKRGTTKPASVFSGLLSRKSRCISLPSQYELKNPAVTEQATHHSRSLDSLALGKHPVLTSDGKDVAKKTSQAATLRLEQSTEETGSSAVSMIPQRHVSQSSWPCVRRDCDGPLENTGSESGGLTEREAMRISETDVEDGRLAADEKPKKVRLPWQLVRKLRELPDIPLKKVKVYTVYRNPLYFPTGIMRSTGPASSDKDARSLTPEKVQSKSPSLIAQSARSSHEEADCKPEARSSQTGRTESLLGVDENLLAWEVMLTVRDHLNSVPPISLTPRTSPEARETARALVLSGMPRPGSPAGRADSHTSSHREMEN